MHEYNYSKKKIREEGHIGHSPVEIMLKKQVEDYLYGLIRKTTSRETRETCGYHSQSILENGKAK